MFYPSLFVAVLLLCGPFGSVSQVAGPIRVHVGAPTRDGFVDASKGVLDSVGDLERRLDRVPGVVVTRFPGEADLTVWIVDRGVGSEAYGSRATVTPYFQGALLTETKMYANTYWVAAVLEVGDYRKELVGDYRHGLSSSFGAWTEAAKELANDLSSWIEANRRRLYDRRDPAPPPPARPSAAPTAWARAAADPDAVWTTTLPGTTARVTLLSDGGLRLVLEGAGALSARLAPDGPGRFVGVVEATPPCAVMAPELTLIDEGGAWTGRTTIYDCTVTPPKAHRTAFRVMR